VIVIEIVITLIFKTIINQSLFLFRRALFYYLWSSQQINSLFINIMSSFWSNVSPLRFFKSARPVTDDNQATTDGVPGDVRVEPSAPAYESRFENSDASTPASFLYSGGSTKQIKKPFETGSPTSPVDKVLDSEYLVERLKYLQML
jgi:hypothetical protein